MRWFLRKYNLYQVEVGSRTEARLLEVDRIVEAWREANGLPHPHSPLCRGYVLDVLRGSEPVSRA